MRTRSFLPLFGFIFSLVLLYIITKLSGFGESALGLVSGTTALITFGTAYALYLGSFFTIKGNPKNVMIFRMRWMREVLIVTGFFGAVIGIIVMSAFVGSGEGIGIGLAASMVAPLYGFIGAVSFYLIEKYIHENKSAEKFETIILKPGINYRSIINLTIIITMVFMAIGVAAMASSPEPLNIFKIFFNISIVYFFGAVLLPGIIIFKGKNLFQAFLVPIMRTNTVIDNPLPLLKIIRGLKRIVSLIGLAAVSATPILIIADLSIIEELSSIFIPLGKSGAVLSWAMLLLLILYLSEGQIIQQNYCKTGEINADDRFFLIKYVFPSFLILFFSMWLAFIFQLFA